MGRLIKYELKKQQTSRNIILALLLVFLLAFAAGIFSDNGNMVGISDGTGDVCWNVCLLLYGN